MIIPIEMVDSNEKVRFEKLAEFEFQTLITPKSGRIFLYLLDWDDNILPILMLWLKKNYYIHFGLIGDFEGPMKKFIHLTGGKNWKSRKENKDWTPGSRK